MTKNSLQEAVVIATGPGAPGIDGKIMPTQVKAGGRVLRPSWDGNAIKLGDEVRSFQELANVDMLLLSRWFLRPARHTYICRNTPSLEMPMLSPPRFKRHFKVLEGG